MSSNQHVILVDEQDQQTGTEEKLIAHQKGLLHRAFSVFVFYQGENNDEPELLLQQRQSDKYHCGELWSNTCCSHPFPEEKTLDAAKRRLKEEMGIELELREAGGFHYIAKFDNGLTENELDHVVLGFTEDKNVPFNTSEVKAIEWMPLAQLLQELVDTPEKFTPWLAPALEVAITHDPK